MTRRFASVSTWAVALGLCVTLAAGCSKARRDSISFVNKGVLAMDRGEPEAAKSFFARAAETDPEYATAQYHLGLVLYHDFHDVAEARTRFLRALELDPQDLEARYQLARLLFDSGATNDAQAQFQGLLDRNRENGRAAYYLGRIAESNGSLDDANKFFRMAVEAEPHFTPSYLALGLLYQKVGAPREAIQVHREAIRLNGDDIDNRAQLAALLMSQGRADEALDLLLAVEQMDPERAEVLFSVASAFLALDNDERASYYLRAYLAANDRRPTDPLPNADVAMVLLDNIRKKAMRDEIRALGAAAEEGTPKPE